MDPIFHSDVDPDPNFYMMRIRIHNTASMTLLRGIWHTTFLDCAAESRIVLVEKLRDAHSLLQTSGRQGHFHSLKVCRISVSPGQKSMKREKTQRPARMFQDVYLFSGTGEQNSERGAVTDYATSVLPSIRWWSQRSQSADP